MKNQLETIINEISSVVQEIEQLKLVIKNLNNRAITNSDKLGILEFLSLKKSRLIESCNQISGVAIETLEKG